MNTFAPLQEEDVLMFSSQSLSRVGNISEPDIISVIYYTKTITTMQEVLNLSTAGKQQFRANKLNLLLT